MTNLDEKTKQKADIISDLTDAINKNDTENIRANIDALGAFISEELKAEYNGVVAASDRAILASRGNRVLTSKETAFSERTIRMQLQNCRMPLNRPLLMRLWMTLNPTSH